MKKLIPSIAWVLIMLAACMAHGADEILVYTPQNPSTRSKAKVIPGLTSGTLVVGQIDVTTITLQGQEPLRILQTDEDSNIVAVDAPTTDTVLGWDGSQYLWVDGGGSGPTTDSLATVFYRLDTSNNPLTGQVIIDRGSADDPGLTIVRSGGVNPHTLSFSTASDGAKIEADADVAINSTNGLMNIETNDNSIVMNKASAGTGVFVNIDTSNDDAGPFLIRRVPTGTSYFGVDPSGPSITSYVQHNFSGSAILNAQSANTILQTSGGKAITSITNGITSQVLTLAAGPTFVWRTQANATPLGDPVTLAHGGSSKALTANNGGIVWTDADSMEVLAGTATARQPLWSGATATPAWAPYTLPATVAQGDVFYGSATTAISALAKDTNATRYMSNQGTSNNPSWNQVNLANGVTGVLPNANLANSTISFTDGAGIGGSGSPTSLGGTYIVSSNVATPRFASLGLNQTAPGTGRISTTWPNADPSGTVTGHTFTENYSLTANGNNVNRGVSVLLNANQGTFNNASGLAFESYHENRSFTGVSGTVAMSVGYAARVTNAGGGNLTESRDFYSILGSNAGGGTFGTHTGFYCDTLNDASVNYAFRTPGGNSIFGGSNRMGSSAAPSFPLDVAGTSNLDGAVVINETGAAVNTRIESDTNANMVFVDGTNDRVGIGTATPAQTLDVLKAGTQLQLSYDASHYARFAVSSGGVLAITSSAGTGVSLEGVTYPNTAPANRILFATSANIVGTSSIFTFNSGTSTFTVGGPANSTYNISSVAASIAAGTGAGTAPTLAITGNAHAGKITLTTGAAPAGAGAAIATITPGVTAPTGFYPLITPGNINTALLSTTTNNPSALGISGTQWTLNAGTTGLVAVTTYIWNYYSGVN